MRNKSFALEQPDQNTFFDQTEAIAPIPIHYNDAYLAYAHDTTWPVVSFGPFRPFRLFDYFSDFWV